MPTLEASTRERYAVVGVPRRGPTRDANALYLLHEHRALAMGRAPVHR
jgi:hypothetical protein